MRRFALMVAGALAGFAAAGPTALAQDSTPKLVGVWRLVDNVNRETASGALVSPFGPHPTGVYVFSRTGQLVAQQFDGSRNAPAGQSPTDPERAALFSSMIAYNGTYTVAGDTLVMAIAQSSIQSWNGTTRKLKIALEGARLTLTTEPFNSIVSGREVEATVMLERVE